MKLRNVMLIVAVMVLTLFTTSCLKSNDNQEYGQEVSPASTGLCDNAWIMDSIGNQVINATQYETYRFNVDGTGEHAGYNLETKEIETIKFTWKPYTYNNMNYLKIFFEGYSYSAQLYYAKVNGTLRFAGTTTYYEMIPKMVPDDVVATKLRGGTWKLQNIDGIEVPNRYDEYVFNADGTGTHAIYNTSTEKLDPAAEIKWKGYAVTIKLGVISIEEGSNKEYYTCDFNNDGTINIITVDPKQVKNYKKD